MDKNSVKIKNADGPAKSMPVPPEMKKCAEFMGNDGPNAMKAARRVIGKLGEHDKVKWYGE